MQCAEEMRTCGGLYGEEGRAKGSSAELFVIRRVPGSGLEFYEGKSTSS